MVMENPLSNRSGLGVAGSLEELIADERDVFESLEAGRPDVLHLLNRVQDAFFPARDVLSKGGWKDEQQEAILFLFVAGFHELRPATLLAQRGYPDSAMILSRCLCDYAHLCEYVRRTPSFAGAYLKGERVPSTTEIRKKLGFSDWGGYQDLGAVVHGCFQATYMLLKAERRGAMHFGWGPNPDESRFVEAAVRILVFSLALLQSTYLTFDRLHQDKAFSNSLDSLRNDIVAFAGQLR